MRARASVFDLQVHKPGRSVAEVKAAVRTESYRRELKAVKELLDGDLSCDSTEEATSTAPFGSLLHQSLPQLRPWLLHVALTDVTHLRGCRSSHGTAASPPMQPSGECAAGAQRNCPNGQSRMRHPTQKCTVPRRTCGITGGPLPPASLNSSGIGSRRYQRPRGVTRRDLLAFRGVLVFSTIMAVYAQKA